MSAARDLVEAYVASFPDDAARDVERADPGAAAALVEALDDDAAATLLRRVTPGHAARVLEALEPRRAAAVLEAVPLGIVSNVMRRPSRETAEALLDEMPADRREALRHQLAYPADCAAGVMDALVPAIPAAATAAEARAIIERQADRLYYYLYVIDAEHRLAGVFDMAELLRAAPQDTVRSVMRTDVTWLAADAALESVFAHPGWRDLDALPVVDADRRFIGMIRHQRMRQLLAARGPADDGNEGVRTVIALGEIYWLGLCGLLQGFATSAGSPAVREEGPS